jgi:tRNA (guanine37-N1)-methyltransferase
MNFHFLSIFPNVFSSYMDESILGRAQKNGAIGVNTHDLRQWTTDKHRTVDDTPYGGGAGMVMKVEPIYRAVFTLLQDFGVRNLREGEPLNRRSPDKNRIILLSAKGQIFTQHHARHLAETVSNCVFICGRYEGVDERVAEFIADEELSIGAYVLTGGELPAMVIADSVSRCLPGVLGNAQSVVQESHDVPGKGEYPQYTKPENFNNWRVPEVLLGGNHDRIRSWREQQRKSTDTMLPADC